MNTYVGRYLSFPQWMMIISVSMNMVSMNMSQLQSSIPNPQPPTPQLSTPDRYRSMNSKANVRMQLRKELLNTVYGTTRARARASPPSNFG